MDVYCRFCKARLDGNAKPSWSGNTNYQTLWQLTGYAICETCAAEGQRWIAENPEGRIDKAC